MKKAILALSFFLVAGASATAQETIRKYGNDSVECVKNLSLFNEYYKMKSYDDAIGPWRWVYANCPASSKKIYVAGERMYKQKIKQEQDTMEKDQLLDSLLMIYDQRIKYYGEEGFVSHKIGLALYNLGEGKEEEAHAYLKKSVDMEGNKTGPLPLYKYFQLSTELYRAEKINKEQILDLYDQLSSIIEFNLDNNSPDSANYDKSRINIETFFGPFASCEDLVNIYTLRLEESPDDLDLVRKIVNLFEKNKCYKSEIYLQAAEKLYTSEPNARSASALARLYSDKGNFTKASGLYLEAIDLDSSANKKALYNLELASLNLRGLKNYRQARVYAQRALALRPGWGSPLILIGDIYVAAAASCGKDDFEKSTVYWAAVDKYQKARKIDASVATEANQKAATYSKYFPNQKESFYRNLEEGQSFKIDSCWINETTTVRYRK